MPRVYHTKKAAKAKPQWGIEKGDSYYYWTFMNRGGKGTMVCSKTPPKPSQLTRSDFMGPCLALQERLGEAKVDDFETLSDLDDWRNELAQEARDLGEEQQSKYDNMPEGLQQGDTGQMIEARANGMSEWADALEAVDVPDDEDPEEVDEDGLEFDEVEGDEEATAEAKAAAKEEAEEAARTEADEKNREAIETALEELKGCEPSVD